MAKAISLWRLSSALSIFCHAFGCHGDDAMDWRVNHLTEQGLAQGQGQRVIVACDLISALRRRELEDAVGECILICSSPKGPGPPWSEKSGERQSNIPSAPCGSLLWVDAAAQAKVSPIPPLWVEPGGFARAPGVPPLCAGRRYSTLTHQPENLLQCRPRKASPRHLFIQRGSAVTPLVNSPAADGLHQPGAKPRSRHMAESADFPHRPRAVGDRQSDSIQVQHRCPQSEMHVSQSYH